MKNNNKIIIFAILVIIVLFHVINNIAVLSKYPNTYTWVTTGTDIQEQIEKTEIASRLAGIISGHDKNNPAFLATINLLQTKSPRPKLAPLIYSIGDWLFGERLSIHIVNAIYYFILILSTYLLAKEFYGVGIGVFSGFLVSIYPMVFILSRTIYLDFPLTAIFIFTLYLIIKTKNFSSRFYSILFGIFLGIGVLIKGSMLIFLLAPFLQCLINIFINFRRLPFIKRYKPFLNLSGSVLIGILISSCWWRGNISMVISKFFLYLEPYKVKQIVDDLHFLPQGPAGALSFAKESALTLNQQLFYCSGFLFFVFIPGLILLWKRKRPQNYSLFFYFLSPLIIFLFSSFKAPRYLIPLLPIAAIITSTGLFNIKNRIARISILSFVAIFTLLQFFVISYYADSYRFIKFYNTIYSEYNSTALKFMNYITARNINSPRLALISESSWKYPDSLKTLRYFFEKNKSLGNDLLYAMGDNVDITECDFVILSLDRSYYLRLASLLDAGRKNAEQSFYLSEFRRYHPWDRRDVAVVLLDPNKFNARINSMKEVLIKGDSKKPLEIYEKLLVLEAIKRELLTAEEAEGYCREIFPDLLFWSKIYSDGGIIGLIQKLTLSGEGFISFLKAEPARQFLLNDEKWKWVYENLNCHKFSMVEQGGIPSLGISFYLFSKRHPADSKD